MSAVEMDIMLETARGNAEADAHEIATGMIVEMTTGINEREVLRGIMQGVDNGETAEVAVVVVALDDIAVI